VPESAARRGSSVDVRALPYDDRRLDDDDRRDLDRLRAAEQDRINDSPERTYALSDVRARGSVDRVTFDVRKALAMLKIDPDKEPSRDDLKGIAKAAEHSIGTTRIQPLTPIEDVLLVVHGLTGAFAGVVHGDKYASVVSFALCDPQPSRRGLLVAAVAPVDVITAVQCIVLTEAVRYEIENCADACDLKYELSSAQCARVVECSKVLAAIDAAAVLAIRQMVTKDVLQVLDGHTSFISCCRALLSTRRNTWPARAMRVSKAAGEARDQKVTPSTSFAFIVSEVMHDYEVRVIAPRYLGLTPEACAALRSVDGVPEPVADAMSSTMIFELKSAVESASAKPGFGDAEMKLALLPLLTKFGDMGTRPGLFKPKTTMNRPGVGVNAVSSDVSKAPKKPWQSQSQKDKLIKSGAPPSDSARRLEHSTEPASGQRPAGNRSASPGGGQGQQRRPEPQPLRQAPCGPDDQ
jgi:hypothetical protein